MTPCPARPTWYTRQAERLVFQHRIASTGLAVRAVRPPKHLRDGFAQKIASVLEVPQPATA
ncbi:hypothetical protein [Streptomyces flavidovirens]|uniref:hypothetical protein n=1 Tax=Streptomyces flavidovirens TaxID=67298 RepID=UPI0012FEAFB5|nr:hypothetical protein [Streptomyces flavidovirens]